jgi:methyl-accepting chemotaxis protein
MVSDKFEIQKDEIYSKGMSWVLISTTVVYIIGLLAVYGLYFTKRSTFLTSKTLMLSTMCGIFILIPYFYNKYFKNNLRPYVTAISSFLVFFGATFFLKENPNAFVIIFASIISSLLFLRTKPVILMNIFNFIAMAYFTFGVPLDVAKESLMGIYALRMSVTLQLSIITIFSASKINKYLLDNIKSSIKFEKVSESLKHAFSEINNSSEELENLSKNILNSGNNLSETVTTISESTSNISNQMEKYLVQFNQLMLLVKKFKHH